ncbi:MAG: hypothetical protein NTW01_00330 [Gammaproteobacteria bacterium]|nr:hypothetical protein [Gammaproteobacteria bacterium]
MFAPANKIFRFEGHLFCSDGGVGGDGRRQPQAQPIFPMRIPEAVPGRPVMGRTDAGKTLYDGLPAGLGKPDLMLRCDRKTAA